MTDIINYFKNTKISGTQKLRDFCGNGIGYDLYCVINHWNNEPNSAIKHIKSKTNNILSVEKLCDIFNTTRYKIYKTKKYLTEIGLLKTELYGTPCHCNYSIDLEIENELLGLEPDYKAKQKQEQKNYMQKLNIPEEMEFAEYFDLNGGKVADGIRLYNNLIKKNWKDSRGILIKDWQLYIRGIIKNQNKQKDLEKQLQTIDNFRDLGIDGLEDIDFITKQNYNKYNNYKPPAPKTYSSNW